MCIAEFRTVKLLASVSSANIHLDAIRDTVSKLSGIFTLFNVKPLENK